MSRVHRQPQGRLPFAVCITFLLLSVVSASLQAQVVQVGAGSYTTVLPAGDTAPSSQIFNTVAGPKPTHRFWTAKNWYAADTVNNNITFGAPPGTQGGPFNMFPQPLSLRTTPAGLLLGFDATIVNGGTFFQQPFEGDLTLGVAGLNAASVNVSAYTDWTVDFNFGPMTAKVGRGMPFVYITTNGSNPTLTFAGQPTVFANNGNILGVSIANNNYGLFCPSGGTWTGIGSTVLTCNLPSGHDYFSFALLPNQAALSTYSQFAFSFPVNTQVNWNYNQSTSQVTTTYTVTTQAREGTQTGFLMALYPHQYTALQGSAINTSFTYPSSRGTLEVLQGTSFTTVNTFHGVLPFLPDAGNFNNATLTSFIDTVANEPNHFAVSQSGGGTNTYDIGKDLARIAHLLPIAKIAGDTTALNGLQSSLQSELQNWFNGAANNQSTNVFYYNGNWGTLVGYPAAFGSDTGLNDHHFHYGYWIHSSAILGLLNPSWIQANNWGGMVSLLSRDIAAPTRNDALFPFLRHFDVYGGHSWAGGQAPFGDGSNQESSSEAVNAWTGLILFATETGNTQLRDAAIWMYTQETNAIFDYWFNDGPVATFPAGFTRTEIANVFDGKADTGTFFSGQIELEHGIEFLPFHGGSLYLGRDPAYIRRNLAEITSMDPNAFASGSQNWPDLVEEFQALADPTTALTEFQNTSFVFDGESKAHEYYWITQLQKLGQSDESVTANTPLYHVFRNPATGAVTHAAFNAGTSAITVNFSDGASLTVPAGSMTSEFGSVSLSGGSNPPPIAPPSNLTATAASSSQINLSWTASSTSGVTYNIYRSTTSGFTPSAGTRIASGITNTTFPNTGLAASTTFFYLVTAANASTESSPSNQASATTQAGTGGTAVGNTLFVIAGATQATPGSLSFSAGTSASTDTIPADNGTTSDGTPRNPLVYRVSGVSGTFSGAATQFSFFVDSKTAAANGIQLQVRYDLTGDGTFDRTEIYHFFATDAVAGFENYTQASFGGLESSSGTLGNMTNGTIEIQVWNAIGTNPSFLNASATMAQGSQSVVVLPFTGLTISSGGGGGCSSAPSAPTGLSASGTTSSSTNLKWTASSVSSGCTVTSYKIFKNGTAIGTASSTSFTVTGLAAQTTQSFTVAATDSFATSPQSAAVSVTTGSGGSGTPVNLSSTYNREGIVSDGTTFTSGGLDGGGSAYSSNLLGPSRTFNGMTFNFGPPNALNVVSSIGQTLSLPSGSFSSLGMLATGVSGNQAAQTFTVHYTDGSTTPITQSISDWFTPQSFSGESIAVATNHRNRSNGTADNRTFNLYGYTFNIDSTKIVSSVTLPNNSKVEVLAFTLNTNGSVGGGGSNFTLSASPSSQTVTSGNGASYTVTVTPVNGFTGMVNLSVSGFPSGASGGFSPVSISGSGSSTLNVSTSTSTPVVSDTLTITANSSTLAHSATVTLATQTSSACTGANCTSKRLKIINGCSSQPMWIFFQTGFNGGTLNAQNQKMLANLGDFIEYDIPDKGLAGVRFWPGLGCDSTGNNCQVGASGGPVANGFTCPAGIGCAPPIDSKFEGTFGCVSSMPEAQCQSNPSANPPAPLLRADFWDASMVDGYTLPVKVVVNGSCPPGNPGGPTGGVVDCSTLHFSDCPTNENLSTNGQFPNLAVEDLLRRHPTSGAIVGCYSPSSKLTMGQWQSIPNPPFSGTTFNPTDPQAQMYACPTPPITPDVCRAGPAATTNYTNLIHAKCNSTYAYAFDDVNGLSSCPATTNTKYEVTFFCPQ